MSVWRTGGTRLAAIALTVAATSSCDRGTAPVTVGSTVRPYVDRPTFQSDLFAYTPVLPPTTRARRPRYEHVESRGTHIHPQLFDPKHLGPFAWSDARWHSRCAGVRTSFNPDHDLREDTLSLMPSDPRWLDFVFWTLSNKLNEHQVEAYGGTGWNGPKGGVVFHWAPGSHWERDSLHSFAFFIGHVVGEHRWTDTMFPDFFEKYGGVYGVNVKDRLVEIDPQSSKPWIDFLAYGGSSDSPYYRYLLHVDSSVDLSHHRLALAAGQGIAFDYSFDRYFDEVAMIVTDCKIVDFFRAYDTFGPGFAAQGNWARQAMPEDALARVGYASSDRFAPRGPGGSTSGPEPPPLDRVEVPPDVPEVERIRHGREVYYAECVDCHGVRGNGAGFLAEGFDVKPRDFREGRYKFRSTLFGELPTMSDLERVIREGVPGTTMPAWGQFMSDEEIRDVARFLVLFSRRFTDAWRARLEPRRLTVPPVPQDVVDVAAHPSGDPRPCARLSAGARSAPCEGEKNWNLLQCRWCHGDGGHGDGQSARGGMADDWGEVMYPADLTYKWTFKNGHRPEDVYRSIFGGLNGTPMQSYLNDVPAEEDRWAIVAYVLSLSPPVRPVLHVADFAAQRATRIGAHGLVLP